VSRVPPSRPAKPGSPLRFSCTSFSFPLLRLPAVARLLSVLEFRHIDLCVADGDRDVRAQVVEADPEAAAGADRKACEAAGLSVVDIFCHLGRSAFDRPVNTPDAAERRRNRERFSAYVKYAAAAGAEGVTMSPGRHWAEIADGGFDLACGELAVYTGWAGARGLRLSVEPHLDSIAAEPDSAARLVERVPGLTLTVDYSHFVARGTDPAAVHPLLPLAGHVHVRQAAPGKLQAAQDEGVIDFGAVLDRLADLGYRGALTLEYLWNPWQGMNRVDVVTETLLLRRRLEARGSTAPAVT
jgi:sugar phosphate isomerase/epimerase